MYRIDLVWALIWFVPAIIIVVVVVPAMVVVVIPPIIPSSIISIIAVVVVIASSAPRGVECVDSHGEDCQQGDVSNVHSDTMNDFL